MASAGLHRDPRPKPRWLQARNLLSEISLRLLVQNLLPFVAGRPINVGKRTQYRPPALKSYLPFALSAAQARSDQPIYSVQWSVPGIRLSGRCRLEEAPAKLFGPWMD